MLKEIYEQSRAVAETLAERIADGKVLDVALGPTAGAILDKVQSVHIVACGTSYHAGLVARYWIEEHCNVACTVEIASEYRYRRVVVPDNSLFITISQSGETADTLAPTRSTPTIWANMVRISKPVIRTRTNREGSEPFTKGLRVVENSVVTTTSPLANASLNRLCPGMFAFCRIDWGTAAWASTISPLILCTWAEFRAAVSAIFCKRVLLSKRFPLSSANPAQANKATIPIIAMTSTAPCC